MAERNYYTVYTNCYRMNQVLAISFPLAYGVITLCTQKVANGHWSVLIVSILRKEKVIVGTQPLYGQKMVSE